MLFTEEETQLMLRLLSWSHSCYFMPETLWSPWANGHLLKEITVQQRVCHWSIGATTLWLCCCVWREREREAGGRLIGQIPVSQRCVMQFRMEAVRSRSVVIHCMCDDASMLYAGAHTLNPQFCGYNEDRLWGDYYCSSQIWLPASGMPLAFKSEDMEQYLRADITFWWAAVLFFLIMLP